MLKKFFPSFITSTLPIVFFVLFPFASAEQASAQLIKMPKPLPEIVKEYKSVTLLGSQPTMLDTGVRVKEGDYVTILADGLIVGPTRSFTPYGRLEFRIGEKGVIRGLDHQEGFRVTEGGNFYLDYSVSTTGATGYYITASRSRSVGFFSIDVIVWKKYDPAAVADFLEEMSLKDPKNKVLKDVARSSKQNKELYLAEKKAKKEVEETKKVIVALKGKEISEIKEAPEKKAVSELSEKKLQEEAQQAFKAVKEKEVNGIKDAQKEKQIGELNERLQKASQALKDLEELKKKVEEQKVKEKELMARLEQAEEVKWKESKIAPLIAIASPKDGTSVDFEYISVAGVAESGKGIAKFEILVNQQAVTRPEQRDLRLVAKDLRRIDFSERIRLREGKNEISVIAQDPEGLIAKKTIAIQFNRKRGEIWAVVIGISKYKNIPSLKYAANDAQAFYRYLTEVSGVPKDHIWLLLDEEATLDKLKSALGTHLRRQAGRDDMVIIYLAGHGATERDAASPDGDGLEKYILPHNADPKDLFASALPMNDVSKIFQRISSEKMVFISDTCYSGASGGRTIPVTGTRTNISGAFLDRISQGKGRVILTASDANEVSVEKDELKHGVFTYYLLEALGGQGDIDKDGAITVDEVYRYVSMKVPQATGQDQHPVKKGEMTGQIILGVVK